MIFNRPNSPSQICFPPPFVSLLPEPVRFSPHATPSGTAFLCRAARCQRRHPASPRSPPVVVLRGVTGNRFLFVLSTPDVVFLSFCAFSAPSLCHGTPPYLAVLVQRSLHAPQHLFWRWHTARGDRPGLTKTQTRHRSVQRYCFNFALPGPKNSRHFACCLYQDFVTSFEPCTGCSFPPVPPSVGCSHLRHLSRVSPGRLGLCRPAQTSVRSSS